MNITARDILVRIPALIVTGVSWYLSSQRTIHLPFTFFSIDKVLHLICYAGFSFSWSLWLPGSLWKNKPRTAVLLTILITAVYGAVDEFHQSFVPGRSVSVFDWIADITGGTLGAFAAQLLFAVFPGIHKKNAV